MNKMKKIMGILLMLILTGSVMASVQSNTVKKPEVKEFGVDDLSIAKTTLEQVYIYRLQEAKDKRFLARGLVGAESERLFAEADLAEVEAKRIKELMDSKQDEDIFYVAEKELKSVHNMLLDYQDTNVYTRDAWEYYLDALLLYQDAKSLKKQNYEKAVVYIEEVLELLEKARGSIAYPIVDPIPIDVATTMTGIFVEYDK